MSSARGECQEPPRPFRNRACAIGVPGLMGLGIDRQFAKKPAKFNGSIARVSMVRGKEACIRGSYGGVLSTSYSTTMRSAKDAVEVAVDDPKSCFGMQHCLKASPSSLLRRLCACCGCVNRIPRFQIVLQRCTLINPGTRGRREISDVSGRLQGSGMCGSLPCK